MKRKARSCLIAMALQAATPALASLPACADPDGRMVALKPAWVVDVERGERLSGRTVLLRGRCIAEVREASEPLPPGATVIELPQLTLLPGLIDAHVHLAWATPGGGAAQAVAGRDEARATLDAGFTTVRNLGSTGGADFALRDAIERGEVPGPRMQVSGPGIGLKGGVCDQVFQGEGAVSSTQEALAMVRDLVARGADVIKLCAGGGVLPATSGPEAAELGEEQIGAIVSEAHRLGRRVAAHAQGAEAILRAVRAGVDSIEHGAFLDEQGALMMKERHVFLVPTLHRLDFVIEQARASGSPAGRQAALVDGRDRAIRQLSAAVRLGVPCAFGTDATVIPHGTNAKEAAAMTAIGLSPAQVLAAATVRAAELLGWGDRVGVIRAGFYADVVGVGCDPLSDLACLQQVKFVMKGGIPCHS